jgi:hypothetical protein
MAANAREYLVMAALICLGLLGSSIALANTFVVPHIIEKSGKISNTPFTFDTTFQYEDPNGQPGAVSSVQTYVYDTTGQPMTGAGGTPVSNPTNTSVVGRGPRQTVSLDDQITSNGGFSSANEVKLGFGVIVVGGADPDGVTFNGFVTNAHTGPFDLSVFGFEPQPLKGAAARTFVIPHVLESSGTINNTQNTFDTTFYMTYIGGLPGGGAASSCDVTLTLFNDDGTRMSGGGGGGGGGILAPLHLTLDSTHRYSETLLEDLITAAGGFGGSSRGGYATLDVTGDVGDFAATSFVAHALTGPGDLAADSSFNAAVVPEPAGGLALIAGIALLTSKRKRHQTRDNSHFNREDPACNCEDAA